MATSVTKNSWKTPETVRIKDWISESVRSGHPSFEKRKYKGTNEGLKDPGVLSQDGEDDVLRSTDLDLKYLSGVKK